MNLRIVLSALTAAALAVGAPALASAQTAGTMAPIPNPPEAAHAAPHKAAHHTTKTSHRRHKAATSAKRKSASAAPAKSSITTSANPAPKNP